MAIQLSTLQAERDTLKKDFDLLNSKISQTEKDLLTMKGNLNAVFGAIQQVDKLMKLETNNDEKTLLVEKEKKMSAEKAAALNIAAS